MPEDAERPEPERVVVDGRLMRTESFELDGSPHDFDQHAELSGFAGDALYELHRLVEGHDGLRVQVTIEWEGTY
jgi:hypothetical protein